MICRGDKWNITPRTEARTKGESHEDLKKKILRSIERIRQRRAIKLLCSLKNNLFFLLLD